MTCKEYNNIIMRYCKICFVWPLITATVTVTTVIYNGFPFSTLNCPKDKSSFRFLTSTIENHIYTHCANGQPEQEERNCKKKNMTLSKQLCALCLFVLFGQQSYSKKLCLNDWSSFVAKFLCQNINVSCCPWSDACIPPPSRFFIFGYLLQAPNNWKVFRFP